MNPNENPIKANPINPENMNDIKKSKNVPKDKQAEPAVINGFILKQASVEINEIINKVLDFLDENPNPDDEMVHNWAEEKGYEVDDVEEALYQLAIQSENPQEELKAEDVPDEQFDAEQLKKGMEVESEHSDDPAVQKAIAKAHLLESPNYYIDLAKMENNTATPSKENVKTISFKEYLKSKKEFK